MGEEECLTSDFKGGGGGGGQTPRSLNFFLQKVGVLVPPPPPPKFTAAVPSLLTGNCKWIIVFNISYFLVGRKQIINLCTRNNNKLYCYNIPDCHWLTLGHVALTKCNPSADLHTI